eukprot:12399686-Karenia_brevis.AAC.1
MVFSFASIGLDLDPSIHILYHRVLDMRRFLAKYPAKQKLVLDILNMLHGRKHVGTYHGKEHLGSLCPAPPPGAPGRRNWKDQNFVLGPVSLLLQQLHYYAAIWQEKSFTIHVHDRPPLHFFHVPFQTLKGEIDDLAIRARNKHASTQRT